ncbi:hypothetical protein ACFWBB_05455 [Streptomyces sp. NPDC060000]|uniref:hypothetical protein n=1 Tax=Streptomyces sp. NPDC060000 TaxID=3347031 RepID=UPI0036BA29DC
MDRQDITGVDQSNTYSHDEAGNALSVPDTSRSGTDNQCFGWVTVLAARPPAWG